MPGAPLWERALAEGRLIELDDVVGSAAYGSAGQMGTTNLVPDGMEIPDLMSTFASFVREVYDARTYGDLLLRAGLKNERPGPDVLGMLDVRKAKIIGRTLWWYLRHEDPHVRRLPFRLLGAHARGRAPMIDELIFHLALFKSLRSFYYQAADACDRAARLAA